VFQHRHQLTFPTLKITRCARRGKIEGSGSRVAFVMPGGEKWEQHRPHPQKEARKYQVESVREFLKRLGYTNE